MRLKAEYARRSARLVREATGLGAGAKELSYTKLTKILKQDDKVIVL